MASHLTADRQKSHMGQEQLTLDLKIQPEPKQLTLDLQIRPEPSLENFAPGDNAELVSVLTSIKREGKGPYFLYLWGVTGSGRTHLLHAVDPLAGFERVPAFSPERTVYTVDDADRLSEDDQQKLFDLMCDIRSHVREGERPGYFLITSGSVPPAQMRGRPDVISRLSWGLVFQVRALSDEQKDQALAKLASDSRIDLPEDARRWMLEHLPRDMGTLADGVFEVERTALQSSRKITRSLVRQCLGSADAGKAAGADA